MFCRKCGRENPEKNKFCNGCGVAFVVTQPPPETVFVPPPPLPPKIIKEERREIEPLRMIEAEVVENKKQSDNLLVGESEIVARVAGNSASPEDFLENDEFEQKEDLSKVFEETELLLDELFKDEKSETYKSGVISELMPEASETRLPSENSAALSFDEDLSKFLNEPPIIEKKSAPKSKNPLIIGAIVSLGLILVVIVSVALFMGGNSKIEEIAESNKSVSDSNKQKDEKPNPNVLPDKMAYVAGGDFMMGNDDGDSFSSPAHSVSVKPFFIDITEVTCEDYKKFVEAENHKSPPSWKNNNFPDDSARKPVTGVTWDDANAYAKWQGKRLPTEEEWEFVARGKDGRIYPWGNDWENEMANADKQKNGVQEVGLSKGKSPFGLYDLVGNAWEWTSSDADAYPNGKPFPPKANAKIIRGGYFGSPKEFATATCRGVWGANNEKDYGNTGFRCASDISENPR